MRGATHCGGKLHPERARHAAIAAAAGLALLCGTTTTPASAQPQARTTVPNKATAARAAANPSAVVRGGGKAGEAAGGVARQEPVAAGTAAKLASARRIVIDLSAQRATLYKGGKAVASFNVSTGKAGWRTPTGNFRIYRKLPGWRRSRLGLMYKPAYFYRGYAIHGSYSVPRYPASHGCVRVSMSRISWLASQLPIGTAVRVQP